MIDAFWAEKKPMQNIVQYIAVCWFWYGCMIEESVTINFRQNWGLRITIWCRWNLYSQAKAEKGFQERHALQLQAITKT